MGIEISQFPMKFSSKLHSKPVFNQFPHNSRQHPGMTFPNLSIRKRQKINK
jgi:hypothetical protein